MRGLHAVSLADAPSIEDIGVASSSASEKSHLSLEIWQYDEAHLSIAGTRSRTQARSRQPSRIPVEEGQVEAYDVVPQIQAIRARRRERRLVLDFAKYLREQGDDVSARRLDIFGGEHIYADLFNQTRNQLIEAKANTRRDDIRMAIGQLADYARFFRPAPHRAVLLESKPSRDLLALLATQEITAIWRQRYQFKDNARGAFT